MLSEITSPKNPRVKRWKDLVRDPALRREAGLFPVDGEHMVREALGAGCLRELILSGDSADKYRDIAESFLPYANKNGVWVLMIGGMLIPEDLNRRT